MNGACMTDRSLFIIKYVEALNICFKLHNINLHEYYVQKYTISFYSKLINNKQSLSLNILQNLYDIIPHITSSNYLSHITFMINY